MSRPDPTAEDMMLRRSEPRDVAAIQAIYARHVEHGTGSFEDQPPSIDEMRQRRDAVLHQNLPHLVAESSAIIVGFAYASAYRTRAAYRYTVEDSVYVAEDQVGKGIGNRLLQALIVECRACSARQMIAVIGDSGNSASIALHLRHGFRHVGTLESVGYKFERWLDVVLMQLQL